jgi:ribosomal protein L12E/L44/L45/RPP1/RPP2
MLYEALESESENKSLSAVLCPCSWASSRMVTQCLAKSANKSHSESEWREEEEEEEEEEKEEEGEERGWGGNTHTQKGGV